MEIVIDTASVVFLFLCQLFVWGSSCPVAFNNTYCHMSHKECFHQLNTQTYTELQILEA
jgi:hypothetical protein